VLLTIGVPSYNRAENVSRLLHELVAESVAETVEIVVVDDGGSDDTYGKLSNDLEIASRVRVLKNETNLGYAGTLARIFAECTTEYLMLIADDDHVIAENLAPLLEYLDSERPSFVAPQFLLGSAIQRGRAANGPIAPREFLACSAHAPGLVYRVEDCRAGLDELRERADARYVDALVYPQVVIVIRLLLAAATCTWLALPTVMAGENEPSGIRDAAGHTYWSVESRWQQLRSFDELLSQHAESDASGIAQEMLDAQRARVFGIMASAIRSEDPVLGQAFDRGAQEFSRQQAPRKASGSRIVKSLVHPAVRAVRSVFGSVPLRP
jgi:glycosyltransferase involved in cell wall biosynthesis